MRSDINLFLMHGCVLNHFSHFRLFATPWTAALQAHLSMGLSRQEYWSGLPFPPPGDLPDPGIEPMSPVAPASQADPLLLSHQGSRDVYLMTIPTLQMKGIFTVNEPT